MTSAQRLVGGYLTGVGYGVAAVPNWQDLAATLKSNRPYAVVIDRKLAQQRTEHGVARLALPHSSRNSRRRVSPSMTEGRLGFSLFTGERMPDASTRPRLIDAMPNASLLAAKKSRRS